MFSGPRDSSQDQLRRSAQSTSRLNLLLNLSHGLANATDLIRRDPDRTGKAQAFRDEPLGDSRVHDLGRLMSGTVVHRLPKGTSLNVLFV